MCAGTAVSRTGLHAGLGAESVNKPSPVGLEIAGLFMSSVNEALGIPTGLSWWPLVAGTDIVKMG